MNYKIICSLISIISFISLEATKPEVIECNFVDNVKDKQENSLEQFWNNHKVKVKILAGSILVLVIGGLTYKKYFIKSLEVKDNNLNPNPILPKDNTDLGKVNPNLNISIGPEQRVPTFEETVNKIIVDLKDSMYNQHETHIVYRLIEADEKNKTDMLNRAIAAILRNEDTLKVLFNLSYAELHYSNWVEAGNKDNSTNVTLMAPHWMHLKEAVRYVQLPKK